MLVLTGDVWTMDVEGHDQNRDISVAGTEVGQQFKIIGAVVPARRANLPALSKSDQLGDPLRQS